MGALPGLLLALGALLLLDARTPRGAGPRGGVARGPGGTGMARGPVLARWWRRRAEMLAAAGFVGVGPGRSVVGQVVVGVLGGLVVLGATGSAGLGIGAAVGAGAVPPVLVRRAARRRAEDRRAQWPDAVDHLASAVRAGLSLPEALAALSAHGPEPLRPAFAAFAADVRATGRLAAPLDRLRERLADPVADRVVETVRMAGEVGGAELGPVLRALSAFLREDARVRAELTARQSWTIAAARLAVTAPWLVLLLLATQPGVLSAYDSPTGTVILLAGAVACAVSYRLMVRIGRLPTDPRLLRPATP